ncbi:MAG: PH domain-containing protein [Myxococcales bacterium]|nr:PH domain-containing protein [Myxococcales bacterium]
MIELIVRLTRPLYVPLLKLKTEPPHLPEGSALVRSLKPSEAWFTWRALTAMFGLLPQVIGTGVGVIALIAKLGALGWALAALLVLFEVVVVSFTLVATRVDYELRFFLVGDRSLRVSEGAIVRREVTLSYANVQNLEVTQGPLERLFGFQNLTVTTAGADQTEGLENSHSVTLVGLDDAEAVRTLILGMLHQTKDAGLGERLPTTSGLSLARLLEVRDAAVALRDAAQGNQSPLVAK